MDPKDPSYDFNCLVCDESVTYKGTCVYASELNYVLFGYAECLCGHSFSRARIIMKRYLELRKLHGSGDTNESIE
jgi:hypothetical protein